CSGTYRGSSACLSCFALHSREVSALAALDSRGNHHGRVRNTPRDETRLHQRASTSMDANPCRLPYVSEREVSGSQGSPAARVGEVTVNDAERSCKAEPRCWTQKIGSGLPAAMGCTYAVQVTSLLTSLPVVAVNTARATMPGRRCSAGPSRAWRAAASP